MQKKYQRKEFIKLAFLTNLALYSGPLNFFEAKKNISPELPTGNANVEYFKKGDIQYETLRKGFNKRIDKFPLIIALCKNTDGVAEAVKYAVQNNLPVSIKSGGHCMEGFSGNNGGLVINLSLLNTTQWAGNDTIKVGPGCTLSDLYDKILPKGKIIPGGSCSGVGIGGLVLGGGYGLMSRRYGLTCDSLQELTMVDGNGNIRNTKDDKELLWACKGGGNGNFGVVTELKFKTHDAPPTFQSFRFKTHNVTSVKAKEILKNWFEQVENLPESCFSAFVLNKTTVYILVTNSDKHSSRLQTIMDSFSKLADKTTKTKPQPLATALKVYYGRPFPMYFKNASAGLYKKFADIENCIDKVIEHVIATSGMIYQVNTLGGKIQQGGFESESAFPHRAYPYFSELQTYWETEKQGKRLQEKFSAVQNLFTEKGINTQYRNYPDINLKNWEAAYYGASYSRLQLIKNKYDPKNIFRNEQSIRNA